MRRVSCRRRQVKVGMLLDVSETARTTILWSYRDLNVVGVYMVKFPTDSG